MPQVSKALAVILLLASVASVAMAQTKPALLEEQAIKQAAALVAPSLVKIETVGGLDKVGQVLTGTGPTTGVAVTKDGYIISSAFNFAAKPAAILATLPDGRRLQATAVATDRLKMLTLLKVEADNLVPPLIAPVESLHVGQWAIALGKTFDDDEPSVSVGIVSALRRVWGKAMQTDAKISPVNYGGPLVDIQGRVMGILVPLSPQASGIMAGVEWYDSGIGFAVPLADVYATLDRLKAGKDLQPGLIGITMKGKNIYEGHPVVDRVRYGSPGQQAGLKEADAIIELDGQKIIRQAQMQSVLGNKYAGDKLALVLKRGNDEIKAELTLTDQLVPYESAYLGILPVREPVGSTPAPGATVRFVFPDSPAAKAGIDRGHRIIKLGDKEIPNSTTLLDLVSRQRVGDKVKLTVMNGEDRREVEVPLGAIPADVVADLPTATYAPKDNATRPKDAPKIGHFTDKSAAHEHDYWAYVPEDYNPEHKYALVVWLQHFDSMETTVFTAWKSQCERRGIILLGPKAKEPGKGWNPNETEFVKELTEQFIAQYSIDKSRVVLHGFDSGGAFGLHLAFKHRELFRAVASVAAPVREQPPDNEPEFRLQFQFISGDVDPVHKLVVGSVAGLRGLKFPVVHTIIEGGDHSYPSKSADRIEEIARWVDLLDRI